MSKLLGRKFTKSVGFVVCQVCNRRFKAITNTHLAKHNTTYEEYTCLFPLAMTYSMPTLLLRRDIAFEIGLPEIARRARKKGGSKGLSPQVARRKTIRAVESYGIVLPKNLLEFLYVENELSTYEIAELLGSSVKVVYNNLKRHGIPTRSVPEAVATKYKYFKKDRKNVWLPNLRKVKRDLVLNWEPKSLEGLGFKLEESA